MSSKFWKRSNKKTARNRKTTSKYGHRRPDSAADDGDPTRKRRCEEGKQTSGWMKLVSLATDPSCTGRDP